MLRPDDNDERRHRESVRWSRLGVVVGIATLVVTVAVPLVFYLLDAEDEAALPRPSEDKPDRPIRIDTRQVLPASSPSWFIPGATESTLGTPPGPYCGAKEWEESYRSRGGILAGGTYVEVTVTSLDETSVVIEGLTVTKGPNTLPPGLIVTCPVGEPLEERLLEANLDEEPPKVRYYSETESVVDRFAFALKKGDVERFLLYVHSERAAYRWTASMSVLYAGRRNDFTIDDNGNPFDSIPDSIAPVYTELGDTFVAQ